MSHALQTTQEHSMTQLKLNFANNFGVLLFILLDQGALVDVVGPHFPHMLFNAQNVPQQNL